MPTAETLLVDACASGVACLDERQLLVVTAQAAMEIMGGGGGGGPFVLKAGDTMTGNLLQPAGAVGAPALASSADTDTGIWYPAANVLGLAAGGVNALRIQTGGPNVASGLAYLYNGISVVYGQTALGNFYFGNAGNFTGSGSLNLAIGQGALSSLTTGSSNCGFGFGALVNDTTGDGNLAFGRNSLLNCNGSNNTAVGLLTGTALTTGSNNLIIGYAVEAPSATGSNQMTIGNIIFATGVDGTGTSLSTGNVGISLNTPTARLHLPAGTATASTAPQKFTAGTLLGAVEIGAMEFTDDGTTAHLYVTVRVATVVTRVQLA